MFYPNLLVNLDSKRKFFRRDLASQIRLDMEHCVREERLDLEFALKTDPSLTRIVNALFRTTSNPATFDFGIQNLSHGTSVRDEIRRRLNKRFLYSRVDVNFGRVTADVQSYVLETSVIKHLIEARMIKDEDMSSYLDRLLNLEDSLDIQIELHFAWIHSLKPDSKRLEYLRSAVGNRFRDSDRSEFASIVSNSVKDSCFEEKTFGQGAADEVGREVVSYL